MYLVDPFDEPETDGASVLFFTTVLTGDDTVGWEDTVGLDVYEITPGPNVTKLTTVHYTDSRHSANPPRWNKADAVKFGQDWYVTLAGGVEIYGGDLFKISSTGTVTDITDDLGITWNTTSPELFGPTAIAKFNGGLLVVTDQSATSGDSNSDGYKFSPNGTSWSSMTPTVLVPQSNGSAIAGSGSNAFIGASGSNNTWLSTDGLAYTDTGVNTQLGAQDNFLTFNDGGVLPIASGALYYNYIDSTGAEYGWSTFNMWSNMKFMLGYQASFGGSPIYGVYHNNSAFFLAITTTNVAYVVEAPTPNDMQTDGSGLRTLIDTGLGTTITNGFGIFKLSANEAVAVTNQGVFYTSDFLAWDPLPGFSLDVGNTIRGAGGHHPDTVTTPTSWLVGN